MSFSVSFFARDIHIARAKLHEASAPAAVKALIELAIAGIHPGMEAERSAGSGAGSSTSSASLGAAAGDITKLAGNMPKVAPPRLCGILVETHGHIDENGGRSGISLFRVEPFYG